MFLTTSHSPRGSDSPSVRNEASTSATLRALVAGVMVFLLLLAARWEIVDSPPYFDFAIGMWPEAEFLADTGFDYHRLRYEETHSLDRHGGRRSYMTSIMPTLLAVVLRATGSPYAARVLYHLFTFACASAAMVLFFRLLVGRVGGLGAFLASAAVLTTPVFATQVDMTGLEMPLVALCLATLACLDRGSYVLGAAVSLGAFLVKPTGLLATVSVFLYLFVGWVLARRARLDEMRRFVPGLVASAAALGIELALLRWGGSIGAQVAKGPPFWMLIVWSPDLLFLALVALVWTGVRVARWPQSDGGLERWTSHAVTLYSVIFVLCVLGAVNGVRFIPRYVAVVVPFVYLILTPLVLGRVGGLGATGLGPSLLAGMVLVNLVNWNGVLFPDPSSALGIALGPPGTRFRSEGSFLERSHEYLVDHRANQAVMATLARAAGSDPIIAGIPFTHFMAYPTLGYVDKPLRGYCINGFLDGAPDFEDVTRLLVALPTSPIFLKTDNGFYYETARLRIPDPAVDDRVLCRSSGTGTVAYRKTWGGLGSRAQSDWYLERLWPADSVDAGAIVRARGSRRQWERVQETAFDARAFAGCLILAWGEWAADLGWEASAARALALANRLAPGVVARAAREELPEGLSAPAAAWVVFRWGWIARARDYLALDLSRRIKGIGVLLEREARVEEWFRSGRDAEAEALARELTEEWPDRPEAQRLLGEALARRGKWEEAGDAFARAVRLAPTYADAYNGLGLALARRGERKAARAAFREATRWDPFHPDAINNWRGMSREMEKSGEGPVSVGMRVRR